ncbi:uncharacterized protein LOC109839523 isoform X5 [Asparagus officinalis]|uniref:uncharacterized protein LOC109839523 isoform X5 n=1 Tax=Asparagus officinalis TaxID=4686 RepID=UPI00098E516F|nr:uncharacterized protein LOC109839523 isoform X5 [Asparagus officinalis]
MLVSGKFQQSYRHIIPIVGTCVDCPCVLHCGQYRGFSPLGQLKATREGGLVSLLTKMLLPHQHTSDRVQLQYQDLTSMQASAFSVYLMRTQAAMDDLIRSSLLPDLKNSLEDTIERQIVRGIATIASQHSKFEVSLSQKFQQDLYFRIPNPEEASSSGAKDQEHSSVGKQDSSVHITTTEGASSSGAKD